MMLDAGRLRHRIDIQEPEEQQSATGGLVTVKWNDVYVNVPAAVEPVSVKEFIASKSMQSEIVARIVIRARPGLTAKMRILHGERIYNPQGWLADDDSGLDYLTAPCSLGTNDG